MKMEQIVCSETSAYIIQTPGNYPKENIIYSEHGESLKSRLITYKQKAINASIRARLWELHTSETSATNEDSVQP